MDLNIVPINNMTADGWGELECKACCWVGIKRVKAEVGGRDRNTGPERRGRFLFDVVLKELVGELEVAFPAVHPATC